MDAPDSEWMTKESVALVIEGDEGILIVRRSDEEESCPGLWGFPAASCMPGETQHDAVMRAASTKLGVEVVIDGILGDTQATRPHYTIHLTDYLVRIVGGTPFVPQDDPTVSQYEEWCFTKEPSRLRESAKQGSLCSQVYLDSIGMEWRDSLAST